MLTRNKLFFAMAFLGSSAAIQAADGHDTLNSFGFGRTGERINKSSSHLQMAEYHVHPTYEIVSGTYNGMKLTHAILHGSFDPLKPSTFIF